VRKAREHFKDDVYLVMGGFHLGGKANAQIQEVIDSLKELGVKKVAPSHCTGEKAMVLFRENWGENFLEGGAGAIIEVAR
jgi:7,8-dihydropterin-6-yl-methyl-4-(beta-D-ribofuranosyl)aminobenzene 5'-phosphate synthase